MTPTHRLWGVKRGWRVARYGGYVECITRGITLYVTQ